MQSVKVALITLVFSFNIQNVEPGNVPIHFMLEIFEHFHGKNLIIHGNTKTMGLDEVMKGAKEIGKYSLVVDYYQENCTIKLENVDVHFIYYNEDSKNYALDCFKHRKRSNKEPWILYSQEKSILDILDELKYAKLDLDDNIIFAQEEDTDNIILSELYKIKEENEMIEVAPIGKWSSNNGLELTTTPKWYRRGNLKGHIFRVTTLVEAPFTSKLELNSQTNKYEIEGSFPDLLNTLAYTMNFTYEVVPPPDNAWGGQQPDGSWNGMMNQVQMEDVDFAPTSLIQTMERTIATSWTIPLVFSYQSIFIKNPSGIYNYTSYVEPLTYMSWIMIVVFLLLIPFSLFLISKYANDQNRIFLGDAFAAVYIAFIMMGSPIDPNKLSTRTLFLSIIVACALLYWHWEAMLVSYLATRKTVLPFSTLSEMYLNTPFRLAMIPATSFEDNFKYSTDKLWQDIYAERIEPHLQEYADYPNHLSDMIYFIRDDFATALYDAYIPITSTVEYQECLIVATKGKYFTRPYAWSFQKNSPYLEAFNFYISEFIEKGQWNAIVKKYEARPQVCPDMSGSPIEFSNCFTAFLILIFGAVIGLILFFAELVIKPMEHNFPFILEGQKAIEDDVTDVYRMSRDELEKTVIRLREKGGQQKETTLTQIVK